MILQSLVRYYEALVEKNETEALGWAVQKVTFGLDLNENGSVRALHSLVQTETDAKGKQRDVIPLRSIPITPKRAVGIASGFLCDNATYLLALVQQKAGTRDAQRDAERASQCFNAAKQLHQSILAECDSDAARRIVAYFRNWQPTAAQDHPALLEHLETLQKGANILFMVNGSFVSDDSRIKEAWNRYYSEKSDDSERAQCLVTGKFGPITRLHPSIKGVSGAQPTGASLVSFNADAYESFGFTQGKNSPVSAYASFAYGTALNTLLASKDNKQQLGDMTIVYWAENAEPQYPDLFAFSLDGNIKEGQEQIIGAVFRALSRGRAVDYEGKLIDPETRFFILGLSPNASRLSVRFFLQDSFGNFIRNAAEHQDRLAIIRPSFDQTSLLSVWRLLNETVNQNATDKTPKPNLAGAVVRAILEGGRYPNTLYQAVQQRIRAEQGNIKANRAAIIKAYLLRNGSNHSVIKEVLTVDLNENSSYLPYVLGRIFSVLEAIQATANPGINTTIKDRYFSSACGTPGQVFPLLIKLSQSHLKKIEERRKIYFDRQLQELLAKLNTGFPRHLNLEEQGAFQLGYYHQTQKRYTKKGSPENQTNGGNENDGTDQASL